MNAPDRLTCQECGEVIPDARRQGVAEWVEGLRVNQGRGSNHVRAWRGLGRWMCHRCAAMYDPKVNTLTEPLF